MKRRFLKDISANTGQIIINQLCGLIIFYILSRNLGDKNDFGNLNFSLAVFLTVYNILSCGIDQVIVRKIAAGENSKQLLSAYFFHVLVIGTGFYMLVFFSKNIFINTPLYPFLLMIGIGKLMIFLSMPFKQLANGLEKFRPLMLMMICSNLVRSVALIILSLRPEISIDNVLVIFVAGDLAELGICILITVYVLKFPIQLRFEKYQYVNLVKESLPQMITTIFSVAIARFDWILIGLIVSSVKLAEYSFAYKMFEISSLPLLVIAPVLIPRFTKIFQREKTITDGQKNDLINLLRFEIIVGVLTALVLIIVWSPVIDSLTYKRYGRVNWSTILLLSMCLPLMYLNNFLWTIHFAKQKMKRILLIISISFIINIIADLILIPIFANEGAAAAYLLSMIVQAALFTVSTSELGKIKILSLCFICIVAGTIAYLTGLFFDNTWLIGGVSIAGFIVLLFLTKQVKTDDLKTLRRISDF